MESLGWIIRLNSLCRALDSEYKINSGGCAKIAYYIAKELQNRRIPYTIKVYFHEDLTSEDCQELASAAPFSGVIDGHWWTHFSIVVSENNESKTINSFPEDFPFVILKTSNNLRWLKAFIDHHEFNPVYSASNNYRVKSCIEEFFKNNII